MKLIYCVIRHAFVSLPPPTSKTSGPLLRSNRDIARAPTKIVVVTLAVDQRRPLEIAMNPMVVL